MAIQGGMTVRLTEQIERIPTNIESAQPITLCPGCYGYTTGRTDPGTKSAEVVFYLTIVSNSDPNQTAVSVLTTAVPLDAIEFIIEHQLV